MQAHQLNHFPLHVYIHLMSRCQKSYKLSRLTTRHPMMLQRKNLRDTFHTEEQKNTKMDSTINENENHAHL